MRKIAAAVAVLAVLVAPSAAFAADPLPESNAEGLVILHDYYPGYWWDHTDLTIAVQAHPGVAPEMDAAVHDAIATWDAVLRDQFDGLITLKHR